MQKSKYHILIAVSFLFSFYGYSQKTIQATIIHDSLTRKFSFYVPANYTAGKQVPLVFNLHGYSSNGDQQEFYGDFRKIADTAGFIVVHPTGTINKQTNETYWNCGLVAGGGVDDVGFIHAIIDTLSQAYSIDPGRIYSTGMSNGGFMSYHLACVSNRFAAIASVAGSMTALTLAQCKNANPTPVMEIHGNADAVVNYDGSTGVLSVPEVLDYWIAKNGLNKQDLVKTMLPDINTADNATAELYIYPGANDVQHYKIINGGHTWPGTPFIIGTTCQDFKASEVIWQFFAKYKLTTLSTDLADKSLFEIYPNPSGNQIQIRNYRNRYEDLKVVYTDQTGRKVKSIILTKGEHVIDQSDLMPGIYFINLIDEGSKAQFKLIKI
jgi:polyhydroxybutyrate depolymerase